MNTNYGYKLPPAEDWELLKVDNLENTHICDRATDKELTVPVYVTGHLEAAIETLGRAEDLLDAVLEVLEEHDAYIKRVPGSLGEQLSDKIWALAYKHTDLFIRNGKLWNAMIMHEKRMLDNYDPEGAEDDDVHADSDNPER